MTGLGNAKTLRREDVTSSRLTKNQGRNTTEQDAKQGYTAEVGQICPEPNPEDS